MISLRDTFFFLRRRVIQLDLAPVRKISRYGFEGLFGNDCIYSYTLQMRC
jgi:hypothetical protein